MIYPPKQHGDRWCVPSVCKFGRFALGLFGPSFSLSIGDDLRAKTLDEKRKRSEPIRKFLFTSPVAGCFLRTKKKNKSPRAEKSKQVLSLLKSTSHASARAHYKAILRSAVAPSSTAAHSVVSLTVHRCLAPVARRQSVGDDDDASLVLFRVFC